jgi:hypothetical protein
LIDDLQCLGYQLFDAIPDPHGNYCEVRKHKVPSYYRFSRYRREMATLCPPLKLP